MLINRMTPRVEAIVGKGYTHYAFAYYFPERGEPVYTDSGVLTEPAPFYVTPKGEADKQKFDDIVAFAKMVGGEMVNCEPRDLVKKLSAAGFDEQHNIHGAAWSKRHVWVGFNL